MGRTSIAFGAAVALVLSGAGPSAAIPLVRASGSTYTITDIGPIGGATLSFVVDINNAGQAAVQMTMPSGPVVHGFLYDPVSGQLTDIGTLGSQIAVPQSISDNGLIAGGSSLAGSLSYEAFLFTPGVGMKDVGVGASYATFAYDVNTAGDVVVSGNPSYVWRPDSTHQLLGAGQTFVINFAGTVFGARGGIPGSWSPPYANGTTFSPFGTILSPYTSGVTDSANLFGEATGAFEGTNAELAFVWGGHQYVGRSVPGFERDFGTAINDAGGLTLGAYHPSDTSTMPFVDFTGSGTPINGETLNPAGSPFSKLSKFVSINDLGQIGGFGQVGGQTHGFILTPPFPIQIQTVKTILDVNEPSEVQSWVDGIYRDLLNRPQATQCFELSRWDGAISVLPFGTLGQDESSGVALKTIERILGCKSVGTPTRPVLIPHVFTSTGQRDAELVKVGAGTLVLQSSFPLGSSLDIPLSSVRETRGKAPDKLKVTKTVGKTFVRVKVSKLKPGALHFTVIAKKLLGGKATPVTTKVS